MACLALFRLLDGDMNMLIGYVRVSTNDQNTALQRNALSCAGCEQIFEDKISGKSTNRPGLKRALKAINWVKRGGNFNAPNVHGY